MGAVTPAFLYIFFRQAKKETEIKINVNKTDEVKEQLLTLQYYFIVRLVP